MRKRKKKNFLGMCLILLIVLYFAIFSLFSPKFEESLPPEKKEEIFERNYSPEECKKVKFDIKDVSCEEKILRLDIFNSGGIILSSPFLGIIRTATGMEILIANSTETPLEINQTLPLIFKLKKLEGKINRIELVFQPCPFSTQLIENLNLSC